MASQLYESVRKNDEKRDALKNPPAVTKTEPSPGAQASKAGRDASKALNERSQTKSAQSTNPNAGRSTVGPAPGRGPIERVVSGAKKTGKFIAERAQGFAKNASIAYNTIDNLGRNQGPATSKAQEKPLTQIPANQGDNSDKRQPAKGSNTPSSSGGKSGFGAAFAAARKAGSKEFTFNGKKYNTRLKGEGGTEKTKSSGKVSGASTNDSSQSVKYEYQLKGGPVVSNKKANGATPSKLGAPRRIHSENPRPASEFKRAMKVAKKPETKQGTFRYASANRDRRK